MIDRLDRLAALLRDDASYCRLATLIEQSAYSEPADPLAAWPRYWIGPFPAVGVVPLPYETVVRVTLRRGTEYGPKPVDSFCWGQSGGMADIVAFSYLADNPEGWVERPEGWVAPDEAWGLGLRWTTTGKHSTPDTDGPERRLFFDKDWEGVTHIRLLPRETAVGPELATNGDFLMGTSGWRSVPIPDDAQAVVREALEAVEEAVRAEFGDYYDWPYAKKGSIREARGKIRAALAALDAAPAEKALTEARPTFSTDFNQTFGSYRAADVAATCTGASVTIDVLAKNKAEHLVITSFSNPANGSLVYNSGDKSFTYTPDDGFSGVDTFSYTVRDYHGTPATAEVTIEVVR